MFVAFHLMLLVLLSFFLHRFCLSQVRAADEMNYDFQALALESRGMGEVRDVWS